MSYIIIRGPAGVGKSTLRKNLIKWFRNKKIKVRAFSPGALRKRYKLNFSLRNKLKADNFYISKAKNLINKNYVIVFDEVYYYKQQISNFNKKLGKPIIISLKASLENILERNNKRKVKKKLPTKTIIEVYNLDKLFKIGNIINTENKSEKQILKEVIKIIKTKSLNTKKF